MTCKDYQLIANALKNARDNHNPSHNTSCDIVAFHVASALESENPRFKRVTFLKACGVSND
jgi:hypothetical protein